MRLVAMSKSEGMVGGGEGLHLTVFCAQLALVGQEFCFLLSMKCVDHPPSAQDLSLSLSVTWVFGFLGFFWPLSLCRIFFLKELEKKAADSYSQDFCGECGYKPAQWRGKLRSSLYHIKLVLAWSWRALTPVSRQVSDDIDHTSSKL